MQQSLNLYYIFYTTARHGSISSASKALYISQPAVSKAIIKLEQNLDTTLFVRSSRGVILTVEGGILYEQLEQAFRSISFGEEQLKKLKKLDMGRLSIGVSTTLCKYILLPYLKVFVRENPYIEVSIACQSTNKTIEALLNGTLDLGLIGKPKEPIPFEFYSLTNIQDIFVTTQSYLDNLYARNPSMTQEDIAGNAVFLMLDKDNLTRQHVDCHLAAQSVSVKQVIEVSTMDLLIEFAKIDLGIACVIQEFVKQELLEQVLTVLPFYSPFPSREIGFASSISFNPAVKKFLSYAGVDGQEM